MLTLPSMQHGFSSSLQQSSALLCRLSIPSKKLLLFRDALQSMYMWLQKKMLTAWLLYTKSQYEIRALSYQIKFRQEEEILENFYKKWKLYLQYKAETRSIAIKLRSECKVKLKEIYWKIWFHTYDTVIKESKSLVFHYFAITRKLFSRWKRYSLEHNKKKINTIKAQQQYQLQHMNQVLIMDYTVYKLYFQ